MKLILLWLLGSILVYLILVGICTIGEAILNRFRK